MKRDQVLRLGFLGTLGVLLLSAGNVHAGKTKVRDLASIKGVRDNYLKGYGLVVGLAGSGDTKAFLTTTQSLTNLLSTFSFDAQAEEVTTQSVASVIVTAKLPAFARNGSKLDVDVSILGDASSLVGGKLLVSELKGPDGRVYALAEGKLLLPENQNLSTSASIVQGATVEREHLPKILDENKRFQFILHKPDFTTASRLSFAINEHLKGFFAKALDHASVSVELPDFYGDELAEFISELEMLEIEPEQKNSIVINERSGTVVMGADIQLQAVTLSHGNLSIQVDQLQKNINQLDGAKVSDLLDVLNGLGVRPKDLIEILKALHKAGAIHAEVHVI